MLSVQHMFPRTFSQTSHPAKRSLANAGLTDQAAVERAGRSVPRGCYAERCIAARAV